MAGIRLKYVHEFRDRFGKLRRYFRRGKISAPLPGLPGSDEFMEAYGAALSGRPLATEIGASRTVPGTIGAAVAAYYGSGSFQALSKSTQRTYRNILGRFRDENGHRRLATLERRHIEAMLSEKAKTPAAANNHLRMVRMLFQFAMGIGMASSDPTAGVKGIKSRTKGFYSWSEEDIKAYETRHPIGTRARLALSLFIYTAQRKGDVVRMGRQHVKDGTLRVRQDKTGEEMEIPVHAELAEIVKETPSGNLPFLVTRSGKPFTAAGFGNLFRQWCDEAGLPAKCSSHGLRKAASRRLAEAGCTTHEIGSITGHTTLKEISRYTRAADRKAMAKTAMEKVSRT